MVFTKTGVFLSALRLLTSRGVGPGCASCLDYSNPTPQQNKDSSRPWCVSTDHRFLEVSLCQQFKTIPQTSQSQGRSGHQQSSRSVKPKDLLFSQIRHQPSVRFQFFRSHSLWPVHRGNRSGLQSSQKRDSFLSSFTLLRIPFPTLLARSIEPRERLYLARCSTTPQNTSGKGSPWPLSVPASPVDAPPFLPLYSPGSKLEFQ